MAGEAGARGGGLTFLMQIGLVRELVTLEGGELSMSTLKDIACAFVDRKFPEHGIYGLQACIVLLRHDANDSNQLVLIKDAKEVTENTLVEVVLSANTTMEELQIRPHVLYVHSYKSPHFCDFCGEMLFGLVRQGLKCEGCGSNFHKRCAYKIPNNCTLTRRRRSSAASQASGPQTATETQSLTVPGMEPTPILGMGPGGSNGSPRNNRSKSWSGRPIWMEKEYAGRIKVPHTLVYHNYTKPTVCQHCKKLLRGIFRQGMQCKDCKFNCHKKCAPNVPKDCQGEVKWVPGVVYFESQDSSEIDGTNETEVSSIAGLADLDDNNIEDDEPEQPKPPLSPSGSNIPLQRVVQSVRHTKRGGSSSKIREGWMVHFTDRESLHKRFFWRLDTRCITLYQNEASTKYFKEIALTDIQTMKLADPQVSLTAASSSSDSSSTTTTPPSTGTKSSDSSRGPHVFEIHTLTMVYYVGEDPTLGGRRSSSLHSSESGVGLEQAKCWETAIRQALMPVTPQTSTESPRKGVETKKKKVPTATLR